MSSALRGKALDYLPLSQSRRATLPPPPPPGELLFLRLVGNNHTGGGKSHFILSPLHRQKKKAGFKEKGGL